MSRIITFESEETGEFWNHY